MASSYRPVAEIFALLKGLEQGLGVCDYSKVEVFRRLQKKIIKFRLHSQSVYWKPLGRIGKKNLIDVHQGVFIHAVVDQVD